MPQYNIEDTLSEVCFSPNVFIVFLIYKLFIQICDDIILVSPKIFFHFYLHNIAIFLFNCICIIFIVSGQYYFTLLSVFHVF